jgi:hypothetical protein
MKIHLSVIHSYQTVYRSCEDTCPDVLSGSLIACCSLLPPQSNLAVLHSLPLPSSSLLRLRLTTQHYYHLDRYVPLIVFAHPPCYRDLLMCSCPGGTHPDDGVLLVTLVVQVLLIVSGCICLW